MKVRLDVDLIPDSLYVALLNEFERQHALLGAYVDWEITAEHEE